MVVCDHVEGLVATPAGPFYGPLAHGFACGAHLPVHVSSPWNALGDPVRDFDDDRLALADSWGITTPQGWRRQADHLLAGLDVGPEIDAVLGLRRRLRQRTGTVDPTAWRAAVRDWAVGQPGDPRELVDLVGVITRYEARFRADGVLPPGGVVNSVLGYDYGRAVSLARRGHGGGFCDHTAAEAVVLAAGALCRRAYTSWADFSAGYALGRVIRFDREEYGHMYVSVRGPHRLLMTERSSPWVHLPFS
ncbi:hypothetical protein BLA60_39720 [Actinophytocola xinjiangensis]|uniref:DUF1266 domain-containing protein n=1 Tax=Actinophytocola xinjiangensis TaxID=485602 RepID=A0A7Z0WDU1_9PSEU|nr:DUF1266 domain-containing protein [Actinophytocola xinjiangensis]OLF04642.1 hypothetical protein BLA60_39720 [Actinophytocola xinjiangensis]